MNFGLARSEMAGLAVMIAVIAGGVAMRSRTSDADASPASRIEVRREARRDVATGAGSGGASSSGSGVALGLPSATAGSGGADSAAAPILDSDATGTIDLNTAGLVELDRLPGIGESRAEAILAHRARIGRFESVDQLDAIPGIGPVTLEKLRPFVRVGPGGSGAVVAPDSVPDEPGASSSNADATPAGSSVAGEAVAPPAEAFAPAMSEPAAPALAAHDRLVDINRASLEELDTLPGIGPALAKRIVEHRATRPFRRPEDLIEVSGIGPKTFEKMRPRVVVRP